MSNAPERSEATPFSLVAWNIFQGLHHRSRRPNWHQNPDIESHLASLDADILVLPEAWRFRQPQAQWAEELADSLGYELHQWVSDSPSRPREISNWRMVILSRIPVRRLDDQVLTRLGGFGQRACVRIQILDSGLTLAGCHLYGIHAARRDPRLWLRERKDFRELAETDDIVAGDMNMWGPVVLRDAPGMRRAVKGRTFTADRPHSQIDHILVSDNVNFTEAEVLPELGSDHRGLRVVLSRAVSAK